MYNRCPNCNDIYWTEKHTCAPVWAALVIDEGEPADMYIDPLDFHIITPVFAVDQEAAASEAAHRYAIASRGTEVEGLVCVGVMAAQELQAWKRHVDAGIAEARVSADCIEWYEVECSFTVTYTARGKSAC